jgi:hypothetical protein
VDIRTAERGEGLAEVSMDVALDEVCKYITKASDLLEPDQWGQVVTQGTLLELCQVDRWPRMFELLGALRPPPREARARLDTSCISDGALVDDFWTQAREPGEMSLFDELVFDVADQVGALGGAVWRTKRVRDEFMAKNRGRPPTWRTLMVITPLHEWIRIIGERARRAFRYRVDWLRDHNPTLFLADMNGKILAKQTMEATSEA